jgi:hypothetical protein
VTNPTSRDSFSRAIQAHVPRKNNTVFWCGRQKKARDARAVVQQLPFLACPGGQNPFPGPPCGATTTGAPGTYATHPLSAPTTLAAASNAITPFFTSFSR